MEDTLALTTHGLLKTFVEVQYKNPVIPLESSINPTSFIPERV